MIVQQAVTGEGELGTQFVGFIAGLVKLGIAAAILLGKEWRGRKPGPEGLAVELGIHLIAQPIAV